jgi:hypothetical protein
MPFSRFGSSGSVLITVLTATALLLLVSLLFVLWKTHPVTCTCNSRRSPAEELRRSTAVFVGKVIHIEVPRLTGFLYTSRDPMIATFQISKVWKGPATRTTDVRTQFVGTCGCKFTEGEDYLVYANGSNQQLVTDRCTRTKPISEAISEVAALGKAETIETGDVRAPSSSPILSSISPRTVAQYQETTLVVIGANFTAGTKVVFDGPQFQSPVELDATLENPSILTVSSTFAPPIFPKEPFVNGHQSYKVNVKNGDGHLSSAAVQLNVIGTVDLLDRADFAGTMSLEERMNLAHRAGLKVVKDANCPGVLWYLDPETNRTLNSVVMASCTFDGHERFALPPDAR